MSLKTFLIESQLPQKMEILIKTKELTHFMYDSKFKMDGDEEEFPEHAKMREQVRKILEKWTTNGDHITLVLDTKSKTLTVKAN